jgi:hypothetical protein
LTTVVFEPWLYGRPQRVVEPRLPLPLLGDLREVQQQRLSGVEHEAAESVRVGFERDSPVVGDLSLAGRGMNIFHDRLLDDRQS